MILQVPITLVIACMQSVRAELGIGCINDVNLGKMRRIMEGLQPVNRR